jgi:hypothetical protein
MKERTPYTYVVLRYRHDAIAGECMNVGVVLHAAEKGFFDSKLNLHYGRLRQVFPDLEPEAFKASIYSIRRGLTTVSKREKGDMLSTLDSAERFARMVLPMDDSSFIWGSVGAGVTADPELELESLFKRFVTWYEVEKTNKRSDSDIWRPVREKLADKNLADRLEKKTVRSDLTSVEFDHTWKNGALHCYQPLSFDLASRESIQDKVAKWSGHLLHLQNAKVDFKPYFIVGKPTTPGLEKAYKTALAALKQSPNDPEIYEESELDELVDLIEDEMRAHDAQHPGRSA